MATSTGEEKYIAEKSRFIKQKTLCLDNGLNSFSAIGQVLLLEVNEIERENNKIETARLYAVFNQKTIEENEQCRMFIIQYNKQIMVFEYYCEASSVLSFLDNYTPQ